LQSPEHLTLTEPLHLACWMPAKPGVVSLLIKYFPDQATRALPVFASHVLDIPGLPLFKLLMLAHNSHLKDVKIWFRATYPNGFPETTFHPNTFGYENDTVHILLQFAVRYIDAPSVIDFIVGQVNNHFQIEKFDSMDYEGESCCTGDGVRVFNLLLEGQKSSRKYY
jgi:hypothetical protein